MQKISNDSLGADIVNRLKYLIQNITLQCLGANQLIAYRFLVNWVRYEDINYICKTMRRFDILCNIIRTECDNSQNGVFEATHSISNISYQCDTNKLISGKRNGIDRIGFVLIRLWWLTLIFGDQWDIASGKHIGVAGRCNRAVAVTTFPFHWAYVHLMYWWPDMVCICITLCWINHVWVWVWVLAQMQQ